MAPRFYFLACGGAFCRGTEGIPVVFSEKNRRLEWTFEDFLTLYDTFWRGGAFIDPDSVAINAANVRRQYSTPTRCATITAATTAMQPQISDAYVTQTLTETTAVWDDGQKLLYWVTNTHIQTAKKKDSQSRYFLITFDVEMSFEFLLSCSVENELPLCGTGRVELINPPIGTETTAGAWLKKYGITPHKLPPLTGGASYSESCPARRMGGKDAPAETAYTYIIVGSAASATAQNANSIPFCLEYGKIDGATTYPSTSWGILSFLQTVNMVQVRYPNPASEKHEEITRDYNYTIDKIVIVPRWLYAGTRPKNTNIKYYLGGAELARPLGGGGTASYPWRYGADVYHNTVNFHPSDVGRTYYTDGTYMFAFGTTNTRIAFTPTRGADTEDRGKDGGLYCTPHVTINAAETGVSITIGADNRTVSDVDVTDDFAVRAVSTASASEQREADTNRQLARISAVVGVAGQVAGSAAAIGSGNVYAGVTGLASAGLSAYERVRQSRVGQYTVPQRNAAALDGKFNALYALGGVCVWEYPVRDDTNNLPTDNIDPQCGLFGWDGGEQYITIAQNTKMTEFLYVAQTGNTHVSYLKVSGLTPCGADKTEYITDFATWCTERFAVGVRLWLIDSTLTGNNYGNYKKLTAAH